MAILNNQQHIGEYEVKDLIRKNSYSEMYMVEDEKGVPFFLTLFVKDTPEKMQNDEHKMADSLFEHRFLGCSSIAYEQLET